MVTIAEAVCFAMEFISSKSPKCNVSINNSYYSLASILHMKSLSAISNIGKRGRDQLKEMTNRQTLLIVVKGVHIGKSDNINVHRFAFNVGLHGLKLPIWKTSLKKGLLKMQQFLR